MFDHNTIHKITDSLRAPETAHVVEIGPGMGALTESLISRYSRFTALEIDIRAVNYLRRRFPGLDVRQADVQDVDWGALAAEETGPVYIIGNLPFNITSPIIFSLLDAGKYIRETVLLIQLEVAKRIVAKPGTKAYGILSVQVQLLSQPELLFRISRNVFFPKPDVNGAVMRLTFHQDERCFSGDDLTLLKAVIRSAFNQRRKILRNSLSEWSIKYGRDLPDYWGKRRAEELEPEEFVYLIHYLQRLR